MCIVYIHVPTLCDCTVVLVLYVCIPSVVHVSADQPAGEPATLLEKKLALVEAEANEQVPHINSH